MTELVTVVTLAIRTGSSLPAFSFFLEARARFHSNSSVAKDLGVVKLVNGFPGAVVVVELLNTQFWLSQQGIG